MTTETTMTKYNPESRSDRRELATSLRALMTRSLFTEVSIPGTNEQVFARDVPETDGKIRVLVYSTIERDEARKCGKDAIRVAAVYRSRDGRERGIASGEKRVNRTGTIDAINDRVISRMRDAWRAVLTRTKCHCGAPQFKSKVRTDKRTGRKSGGNLVCADLCWKSDADLASDNRSYKGRRRNGRRTPGRRNYSGGYRRQAHAHRVNTVTGTADIDFDIDAAWANAPAHKQVARMMAQGDNSGFDWDRWADEQMEQNG